VVRLQGQRSQIDVRIFPDLIVDKPLKHKGKESLKRAAARTRRLLVRGFI
jgi:hypothetical protein